MAALNAFYVRASGDKAMGVIRAKFPSGDMESTAEFIGVTLANDAETPEQDLMALSSHLNTGVFWLSFQSVVNCFEYHHWQAGWRHPSARVRVRAKSPRIIVSPAGVCDGSLLSISARFGVRAFHGAPLHCNRHSG